MSAAPGALRRAPAPGAGRLTFLRSWEEWITFGLLGVALFAVMSSIEAADWVDEMPSLAAAAGVGLLTGWVLAHLAVRAWVLHLAGIGSGLVVVAGMVLQTMRLADPVLHAGLRGRWSELWARNADWFEALRSGGISSDPLPFVLLMTLLAWALGYLAAWSVGRWRNPWLALVPGGIVLLTNISYLPGQPARWFMVFLFAALLLFARVQLTRAAERGRGEGAEVPDFISLEVLHITWWVGLLLLGGAWLLPVGAHLGPFEGVWERVSAPVTDRTDRLGRAFVGVGSKRPTIVHGSPDALPLQGKLTLSEEPLLRVEAPEELYLRFASFDTYTAEGWTVSGTQREPVPELPFDEASAFGTAATRDQFRAPLTVRVTIDQSFAERRLVTAGEPLTADRRSELVTGAAPADLLGIAPAERVNDSDTYTTVGTISLAPEQALIVAGANYPAWVRERYLALPEHLPPDVAQLARAVTAGADSPYVAARLIEQFLREQYPVDLAIDRPPPRADAVAYFLFDARRGYFDYHASAMAVMLRTLGVPARVSVGFALDDADLDAETKQYVVSEERAWAWPEVYFPGFGWVEFNPTPGRSLVVRPQASETPAAPGSVTTDPLATQNAGDELLFGPNIAIEDLAPAEGTNGGGGPGAVLAAVLLGLFALAAVALVMALGVRLAWERGLRGLDDEARRWAVVLRLAGWTGLRVDPHQTPLEVARTIEAAVGPDVAAQPLARAYNRVRYGGAGVTVAGASDLRAEYVALRRALVRERLRRWQPWRRQHRPATARPAGS